MIGEHAARHGVAGAVTFAASPLGGPVVELAAGAARAVVALKGGQVLSYRPADGAEVLWLSPLARLDTAKAVRGGIPVCWPWFGPHPSEPGLPAHGLVRTAPWDVVAAERRGGAAWLRLRWHGRGVAGSLGAAVDLTLDVTLAEQSLALELVTDNGGPEPITVTEALHTYLSVGDIGAVEIGGLEGLDYVDQCAGGARRRQAGAVTVVGEVDRIYLGRSDRVVVADRALRRRIVVAQSGSAATVVWNPWVDKAARLGDVGADGYRRFVCVETANAADGRQQIAAGASHRLRMEIGVAPAA